MKGQDEIGLTLAGDIGRLETTMAAERPWLRGGFRCAANKNGVRT
jgi:hypothetical protein